MNLLGNIVSRTNVEIIWDPNVFPLPVDPVSLTGAIINLTLIYPDGNTRSVIGPFVVASNGLTASYVTKITDFPVGGRYTLQFNATGLSPGNESVSTDPFYQLVADKL